MSNLRYKTFATIATLALCASAQAQVLFNGDYQQNFNTLSSGGGAWTDNSTLTGWYANKTTYIGSTGNSNTGGLHGFGVDTDRALGGIGSNSAGNIVWGVQIRNNTGAAINSLTIAYTGEQWRNGGNADAQPIEFAYSTTATNLTGTFTDFNSLDFTSPVTGATAAILNGNNAPNFTNLSQTLNVSLATNATIWLRWTRINSAGNDHGIAIDNVRVTSPTATAVPEPGSLLLIGLGFAGVVTGYARRVRR